MTEPKRVTSSNLAVTLVIVGVLAYLLYFFSLKLPNAHVPGTEGKKISRLDIWQLSIPGFVPGNSCLASQALVKLADVSHLSERVPIVGYAIFIVAAGFGVGAALLRLLNVISDRDRDQSGADTPNPCVWSKPERLVVAYGIGMSLLSLTTLGLGLAGWMNRGAVIVLLGVAVLVPLGWRWRQRLKVERLGSVEHGNRKFGELLPPGGLTRLLFVSGTIGVGLFLAISFLGAMLPATDFDVREYHVQGPKEFYLAGRIGFVPHNVYMIMPFGTEMLTLLGMIVAGDWWWGALVGQTVLATFAPMTALAVWSLGRRLFSPAAGWLGALIYLTTPWVHRISIIPYTENALCFFLLAGLLVTVRAIECTERGLQIKLWSLAGALAGSAAACKYPALVSTVFPLGLAVLVAPLFARRNAAQSLPGQIAATPQRLNTFTVLLSFRSALAFTLGVAITFGPWLAKNWAFTGNPTYPLLYGVFGGRNWTPEKNAKWEWGHRVALLVALGVQRPPDERPVYSHDPQHALTLSRLKENVIDVTAQADWLSPLLFGLAPLALFAARGRAAAAWLWLFVAYLFFQWWLLTHRLDRFWVPLIPVVSMLAGAGATWNNGRVWKSFLGVVTVLVVFFNFSYCTSGLCGDNRYSSHLVEGEDPTDPAVNWLNRPDPVLHIEPQAVLAVGSADLFHLFRPVIYNTVFDDCIFEQLVKDSAGVRAAFDKLGIRYVYVNWREVKRYQEPGSYGFTDFVRPHVVRELVEAKVLSGPEVAGPPMELNGETVPSFAVYIVDRGPRNQ